MQIRKTVSLAMIIKNEEDMLEQCLLSVKDIVDEIIIVDTGSTDSSISIAKKFTDKIYKYKWNNNFSEARNYSISKCTKDWILFLDADDYFCIQDKSKFLNLVNNSNKEGHFFITKNFMDLNKKGNYSTNLNIRLVKNKGQYKFIGAIHEQLVEKRSKILDISLFSTENITIEHRGYLKDVASKQNKRERNINIIKDELLKRPNDSFMNFNMGNEYLAVEEYEKALEYYTLAYKNGTEVRAYTNKLFLRMILCYSEIKDFKNAIKIGNEAIEIFPKFAEIYYSLGNVFEKERRYTLAIENYKKAVSIGESPKEIKVINGCGTFMPLKKLGVIYRNFRDYKNARVYFQSAMDYIENKIDGYYDFIYCLLKESDGGNEFINKLKKIDDIGAIKRLIVSNLLVDEGFYEEGVNFLDKLSLTMTDHHDFIRGKALFFENKFNLARESFNKLSRSSIYYDEGKIMSILSLDIEKSKNYDLSDIKDDNYRNLLSIIISANNEEDLSKKVNDEFNETCLGKAIKILEMILKTKRFDYFQNALEVLNYINSKKVLCELGKLYFKNSYGSLGAKEILKSWSIYEFIDEESYWIFLNSI